MTVEVTDDNTVVLSDPKKGKLVYKKKLDAARTAEKASRPLGREAFFVLDAPAWARPS
jgi:hypothetical protein